MSGITADGNRPTASYPSVAAGDMVTALRTAREERGWSLRQVAAEVGTTASAVMYWEHGKRMPTLVKAIAWAEVLGYDLRLQDPAGQPEATEECPYLVEILAGRASGPHSDAACGWCNDVRLRGEERRG